MRASETGILHRVRPTVFLRADVVNDMRQNAERLSKLAVFAAPLRPLPDLFAPKFRYGSTRQPGFLEGMASLGLKQVDEFANAQKSLQRDAFFG